MRQFSIENAIELIYDSRVKEYFYEVVKSYYSENYRAATVLLYTVTICDLVYKLQNLKDIYSDKKATEILKKVEEIQTKNPSSAEWEGKLVDLVKDETSLLEASDYHNIGILQKHRHLCAHPVITQNYELFAPNRETVRAHMANMLEGVLTKPPFLSRRIFDDFLTDLANVKGIILSDDDLERYLTKKYFEKLNPTVENQIIKSLWKIVFKVDDGDCNANREINFKALDILFDRNYDQVLNYIRADVEAYSDVDVKFIDYLIDFFNNYPNVFKLMAEHMQIVVKSKIREDPNSEAYAMFLSRGVKEHLAMVVKKYPKTKIAVINLLYHMAVLEGHQRDANAFVIKMFGSSTNFNMADARYNEVVQDFLQEFDANELELLLQEINSNDQIYDRSRARFTNRTIKQRCLDILGEDFNFKKYPNFYHSLQEE